MASLPVSNDCQAGVWSRPRAVLTVILVATLGPRWDAERCVSAWREKAWCPLIWIVPC